MYDVVSGYSTTSILHHLNQTPSAWSSSHQGQVETAMYGSKFMAAHHAVKQIITICYSLHMLGIPLDGPACLLGDNQAIIDSMTVPHSSLSKHWNALSNHQCHEAVAAGFVPLNSCLAVETPVTSSPNHFLGPRPMPLLNPHFMERQNNVHTKDRLIWLRGQTDRNLFITPF